MNSTNWEHAMYMLGFMIVCVVVSGLFGANSPLISSYIGYSFGLGVFLDREYTQAEKRAAKVTGKSLTQLQFWHVLKFMTLDGFFDWFIPALVGGGVCLVIWGVL